jgi:FkbM family methyltransferase
VGANIGTTAIPLARDGWTVIAVEPVPETFSFLQRNVGDNDLDRRIACVQAAISDRVGTVSMSVGNALSVSHVVGTPDTVQPGQRLAEVDAMTLEGVIEACGHRPEDLAFVWCDAEGSESAVINGAPGIWNAGVPLHAECLQPDRECVERFLHAAVDQFTSFVPDSALRASAHAEPQPITALPRWSTSLTGVEDVLLLP